MEVDLLKLRYCPSHQYLCSLLLDASVIGTLDWPRVAIHAALHPVALIPAAKRQETELHSAVVLMTLSLMVIPSMDANHSAHAIMTALMTTVAKPPSVYVCANLVHAASMPIVMLAITKPGVPARPVTQDSLRVPAERILHLSMTLLHVLKLMSAVPTHVVKMLNADLVVSDPSAPVPLVMKEIHLSTADVESVLRPMTAHPI